MIQRHKGNRDAPLFGNALDVVVLDEAHLYAGTLGGEIAMLLRRVRERCGRGPSPTTFLLRAKSRRGPTPPHPIPVAPQPGSLASPLVPSSRSPWCVRQSLTSLVK